MSIYNWNISEYNKLFKHHICWVEFILVWDVIVYFNLSLIKIYYESKVNHSDGRTPCWLCNLYVVSIPNIALQLYEHICIICLKLCLFMFCRTIGALFLNPHKSISSDFESLVWLESEFFQALT